MMKINAPSEPTTKRKNTQVSHLRTIMYGMVMVYLMSVTAGFYVINKHNSTHHTGSSHDGVIPVETVSKKGQEVENLEGDQAWLGCGGITSEKICEDTKGCRSVYGTKCGTSVDSEEWIGCAIEDHLMPQWPLMGKKQIDQAIKDETSMKMPPSNYLGHPQLQSICAKPPFMAKKGVSPSTAPSESLPKCSLLSSGAAVLSSQTSLPYGWIPVHCSVCCREAPPIFHPDDAKLTLIALVRDEWQSLNNSVHSWHKNGLLDYVDEKKLWINEPLGGKTEEIGKKYNLKLMGTGSNEGIAKAIFTLISTAETPLVLLMEKDWDLIMGEDEMRRQMDAAKRLLLSSTPGVKADAVKFRSRWQAGRPNIKHEDCIPPDEDLNDPQSKPYQRAAGGWWQPHLFCNIYHYEKDVEVNWSDRAWSCGCNPPVMCLDSAQCGWTNNPIMFRKSWFLDVLGGTAEGGEHDGSSFEGLAYYNPKWLDPHWVIAQTDGLFMHHEIGEHEQFDYW